jgi:DNA mismatch repair protein MutL
LSVIRILSEHLANQIAAGEVIERPASVLKEFLENSIDAGARHIAIQIEGDGTRLIRLIDDGIGMDQDDVLLCLERHATSKLSDAAGMEKRLSSILTLGFRGEAIPSIASVSRLAITSRPEKAVLGSRVEVKFGRVVKVHETGCSRGTIVEMRDLFGNMPARKKFLKSRRTEIGHLEQVARSYCLASSQLGMSLLIDGRTVFDLPAAADSQESRVRWFLGRRREEPLLQVGSDDAGRDDESDSRLAVSGFLLPPDEAYGPTARLKIFVNGRAVKDKMITHGIIEGLAGFLMKGRSPAGVLYLDIAPSAVDVNVHPTKQEVRFEQPQAVHQFVSRVVRQAILAYQHEMKFSLFGAPLPPRSGRAVEVPAVLAPPRQAGMAFTGPNRQQQNIIAEPAADFTADGRPSQPRPVAAAGDREQPSAHVNDLSGLVPIGQLMNLYILCERNNPGEEGLVVIDQHAVHERILFENLKSQFATRRVTSQSLLFPKLVDFTPNQLQTINRHLAEIERLGIDLEEFGDGSYIIKAVPAILAHLPPEEIMTVVISEVQDADRDGSGDGHIGTTRIEDILSSMACKAAVKAGCNLTAREIDDFLRQMREADIFSHCPHGRPVLKIFTAADIKRWFHRT